MQVKALPPPMSRSPQPLCCYLCSVIVVVDIMYIQSCTDVYFMKFRIRYLVSCENVALIKKSSDYQFHNIYEIQNDYMHAVQRYFSFLCLKKNNNIKLALRMYEKNGVHV